MGQSKYSQEKMGQIDVNKYRNNFNYVDKLIFSIGMKANMPPILFPKFGQGGAKIKRGKRDSKH